jgi:acyl-homoserine lactone acylase PvdQ
MQASHSAEVSNFNDLKNYLLQHTDSGPNMNVLIATKDNHIGYVAVGSLPVRKNPYSGILIKDGTTFDHDWKGLIRGE